MFALVSKYGVSLESDDNSPPWGLITVSSEIKVDLTTLKIPCNCFFLNFFFIIIKCHFKGEGYGALGSLPQHTFFFPFYLVLFQRKVRGMDYFRLFSFVLQNYGACFKKGKEILTTCPLPPFTVFPLCLLESCFLCVMHIIAVTNKLFLDLSK